MASSDQRFVKVARFLLDGRGLDVAADVRPDGIDDVLEDGDVDASSSIRTMASEMRSGCRTRFAPTDRPCPSSSSAQTRPSELPQASPIYDKWDQMDEAIDALAAGIAASG